MPITIVALGTPASTWLRGVYHPSKHYLYHPGSIRHGLITREQFVQKLKEIHEIYRTIKVEREGEIDKQNK